MLLGGRPGIDIRLRHGLYVGGGVDPRWDNLVAGWKLDESSDGSGAVPRADVLGTYELTDNNTTPSAAGKISNGASFTAANSESLTRSNMGWTSDTWTICFWFNGPDGAGGLVELGDAWATQVFGVHLQTTGGANNQFRAWASDGVAHNGGVLVTASGTENQWHLIVATFDGTNAHISLDGAAFVDDADTIGAQYQSGTMDLKIGEAFSGSGFLTGTLDEVYMFSDAKNITWVSGLYNSGAGRSYPD